MNNLEKQLIDKLRKSDIHLTVSRLAEDLSGYDSGDNCIWELSPEKLHSIETYSARFFTKSAKTDYLGREHFLAVIPKNERNKIELKEE